MITGPIQEMQRTLQDQDLWTRKMQKGIARLHAQVPQATYNQPPILQQINMEEAIRPYLVWIQPYPIYIESLMFQEAIRHMDASFFFKVIYLAPVYETFNTGNLMLYPRMMNLVVHV